MTPDRGQCPICLSHVRLKPGGELYSHVSGRLSKPCAGTGLTREAAKVAKAQGTLNFGSVKAVPSPGPEQVEPEEIF